MIMIQNLQEVVIAFEIISFIIFLNTTCHETENKQQPIYFPFPRKQEMISKSKGNDFQIFWKCRKTFVFKGFGFPNQKEMISKSKGNDFQIKRK